VDLIFLKNKHRNEQILHIASLKVKWYGNKAQKAKFVSHHWDEVKNRNIRSLNKAI
jgi:hypothetical protein